MSLPDSHWYHVDGGIQNTEPASNTLVIPALNRKERNSFGDNSRQSVVTLILLVYITLRDYARQLQHMEDNGYSGLRAIVLLTHPHPTRVLHSVTLVTLPGRLPQHSDGVHNAYYRTHCSLILKDLRITHYQHRNYGCLTTICSGALSWWGGSAERQVGASCRRGGRRGARRGASGSASLFSTCAFHFFIVVLSASSDAFSRSLQPRGEVFRVFGYCYHPSLRYD